MNAKASLAVALLTLFVAVVAHEHPKELQHECIQGTPAIAALQERGLTKKVQKTTSGRHFGAKSFAPLRIVTSTLDLYDPSQYCTQAGDVRKDFQGDDLVCTDADVLTDDKRNKILELIPLGVARLKQLYAVDRVTSPVQVGDGACENVTTPANHTDPGVSDADFVLYITAGPTRGGTIAWAYTCSYDDFGRPLIGHANFGPGSIPMPSTPTLDTQVLNVFIHESTHALGYNKYFWFSPFWAGDNVVINATVRGHPTQVFSGAAVVERARAFFGCKTLFYVDLENEGGAGSLFMHWDRHTLQQELMCAAGGSKYSVFTLAVLEDSGHYAPYYANADDMDWGKGAGCGFVTESCAKTEGGRDTYFCFDQTGGDACTYNRKGIGYCGTSPFSDPIPSWGQYFYDEYVGGSSNFMDYCPVVKPYQNRDCTASPETSDEEDAFGHSWGQDSRCFYTRSEGQTPFGLMDKTQTWDGGDSGFRCLRRRCTGNHQLEVFVGQEWLQCDKDGTIVVSNSPDNAYSGIIDCGPEFTQCTGLTTRSAPSPAQPHTPIPATVPPIEDGGCSSPTNGQIFQDKGVITTDLDGVGGVRYQPNENCVWSVTCTGLNTYVWITNLQLRTEDGFDWVRFEVESRKVEGSKFKPQDTVLLGQYSGAYSTPNVIGPLPGKPTFVNVRFVSDDAGQLNGATIEFECRPDPLTSIAVESQCDNNDGAAQITYVSMTGKVESDIDGAGPQVYMNQPYCLWKIHCPPDAVLSFDALVGQLADDDMIILDSGDNPFEQALGSWGPLSYSDRIDSNAISVTLLNAFSASNSGGTAGFTLYYTCVNPNIDFNDYCNAVAITSAIAPTDDPSDSSGGNPKLAFDGILEHGYAMGHTGPFALYVQLAGSFSVDSVMFYSLTYNSHSITHTISYSTDGGLTYTPAGDYTTTSDSEFGSVTVGQSGVTHIKLESDNDIDHYGDGYAEVFVCGTLEAQPEVRITPTPATPVPTPSTCFSSPTHGTYYYDLNGTIMSDTDGAGPAEYSANELCSWHISCPAGATPFIDGIYGHTEQGYDFVYFKNSATGEVYMNLTGGFNWTAANDLVIGSFYDVPETIEVQLVSDYGMNDAGFTLDYTCVSQATFSKWRGALGRGSANRSALFLGGAIIRGTEVKGEVIRGTVIRGTIIRGTMTRGTIIRGTIERSGIIRGTVIRGTIIRGTVIRGTVIRGTVIRGTVIRGTVIRGTPICMTYDGVEYQCDYWGEALVVNCQRPSDISPNALIIHARAEPPYDGADHTVVTGIAVKDGDVLVAFERDLGTGEITTTLNGVLQEGNMTTGAMYVIYWPDATIEVYSFVDYTKIVINPYPNTITYSTILSEYCMDYTFGLIGNFDVDPYNDFQSLDLSVTLPIDAPQSDIYQYFILSYLVTDDSESLFPIFTPPHLDFVPQFITDDMIFNCPDFCNQEAGCCYTAAVAGDAVASEDLQSISFSLQTSSNDICTTVLDTCEVWIMGKCVCDTTQAPESFCTEYVANCLAVESACLAVANACFDAVGRCFTNGNNGSPIPVPI